MSLETEIQNIAIAINNLTVGINRLTLAVLSDNQPVEASAPIKQPKTVKKIVEEAVEETLTLEVAQPEAVQEVPKLSKDELQAQCLKLVRADRTIKVKLQEWLKDRSAGSLAELAVEHLADFKAFVDALEVK